ncbi:MAG: hypothetical protein Q4B16_02305, partial [Bacteroidia bacterium]|nr:hypothetical protein [Bacteroidia bacterium]
RHARRDRASLLPQGRDCRSGPAMTAFVTPDLIGRLCCRTGIPFERHIVSDSIRGEKEAFFHPVPISEALRGDNNVLFHPDFETDRTGPATVIQGCARGDTVRIDCGSGEMKVRNRGHGSAKSGVFL